jgi:hypothetical protein
MSKPLTAKYRLARNIHEGMEIRDGKTGEWLQVVSALHVVAPLPVSSFDLADGSRTSVHPQQRVMCRRVVVDPS